MPVALLSGNALKSCRLLCACEPCTHRNVGAGAYGLRFCSGYRRPKLYMGAACRRTREIIQQHNTSRT